MKRLLPINLEVAPFRESVTRILGRKAQGIDCNADESVILMDYLRWGPDEGVRDSIAYWFPLEVDQYVSDTTTYPQHYTTGQDS